MVLDDKEEFVKCSAWGFWDFRRFDSFMADVLIGGALFNTTTSHHLVHVS